MKENTPLPYMAKLGPSHEKCGMHSCSSVCVCTDIMMAHVFSLFYALVSHSDIEV